MRSEPGKPVPTTTTLADLSAALNAVGNVGDPDIVAWGVEAKRLLGAAIRTSLKEVALDRTAIESLFHTKAAWEPEIEKHSSVKLLRTRDWANVPDVDFVKVPARRSSEALDAVVQASLALIKAQTDEAWAQVELLNYIADGAWLAMRLTHLRKATGPGEGETYGRN